MQTTNAVRAVTHSSSLESQIASMESKLRNSESSLSILESDYRKFFRFEMTCRHFISTQISPGEDASANAVCDVTLVHSSESR